MTNIKNRTFYCPKCGTEWIETDSKSDKVWCLKCNLIMYEAKKDDKLNILGGQNG